MKPDTNQIAHRTMRQFLARNDKNPAAVALGRLGGRKGGPARAAKLTALERSAIASKAAKVRWGR